MSNRSVMATDYRVREAGAAWADLGSGRGVVQVRERCLPAIHRVCGQADDKADMSRRDRLPFLSSREGFSLIELMVAIAITGLVLAAIAGLFTRSSRLYTLENARAELQQEMRATLEVMVREMRMAAYDPTISKNFSIKKAEATHFQYATDDNDDGTLNAASCENESFRLSAANNSVMMICGENTAGQNAQTLLGDTEIQVTGLNFDYRNNQNNPETNLAEISGVVITLIAQIPAGQAGMESRTFSTWVDLRNMGPNMSKM